LGCDCRDALAPFFLCRISGKIGLLSYDWQLFGNFLKKRNLRNTLNKGLLAFYESTPTENKTKKIKEFKKSQNPDK
jgi:hypothetical protein